MTTAVSKNYDVIDLFVKYFADAPRDLFRALNNIFFYNKQLIGKETKAISKGLKNFSRAADIFSIADFFTNLNTIRNHFNKKEIQKDMPILFSDTANSIAETTSWLSSTGVLSLSAYASSWITSVSGMTLIVSFSKRSIQNILELKKSHKNLNQRKILMLNLAKNISFFAIGIILFANGWFGFALNMAAITISSSAAIISSFASFCLKNKEVKAI